MAASQAFHEPPPGSPQSSASAPSPRAALLVLAIGLALYLPSIHARSFDGEEGRRVLLARAMLESGDWVVPRLLGEPALSKPPLVPWLVALCGALLGHVGELAARLPSVLASLATALLLLRAGARLVSPRAGLAAALAWIVSPAAFQKAAVAETDTLLVLFTAAATLPWLGAFGGGARPGAARVLASGGALAMALLAKGPPALLFYAAMLAALAWTQRSWAPLTRAPAWIALALGLLPLALWAALVARRMGGGETIGFWMREMSGGGASASGGWARDRFRTLSGVLIGFLPAALLSRAAWREPAARALLLAAALCVCAFLLGPRCKPRYVFPAGPWIALAGGLALERTCAGRGAAAGRGLERRGRAVLAVFGVFAAAHAVAPYLRPREDLRALAAAIDARLPAGASVYARGVDPDVLAYLSREVGGAGDHASLPLGAYLLALEASGPRPGFELVARLEREDEAAIAVLRRSDPREPDR